MLDRYFSNDRSVVYANDRYVDLASSVDAITESTSVVDETDGFATTTPSTSDMVDSDPVVSDLPSSEVSTEIGSEVSTEEITTEISTEATTEEISTETVSSNEIVISGGTVSVNNVADYTDILQDISADIKSLKEEPKLFDKPLNDYTVSEGLLLLIFVLLLAMFVSKIMRGGERHV